MFTACELGVFDLLLQSGRPLSLDVIAARLGTSIMGMERLLDACVGLKLLAVELRREGGKEGRRRGITEWLRSAGTSEFICPDPSLAGPPRAVSRQLLEISKEEILLPLGSLCFFTHTAQKCCLVFRTSRILVCAHCLLSWHSAPQKRAWLHLLSTL